MVVWTGTLGMVTKESRKMTDFNDMELAELIDNQLRDMKYGNYNQQQRGVSVSLDRHYGDEHDSLTNLLTEDGLASPVSTRWWNGCIIHGKSTIRRDGKCRECQRETRWLKATLEGREYRRHRNAGELCEHGEQDRRLDPSGKMRCYVCRREQTKLYYRRNREKVLAQKKEYYDRNVDDIRTKKRAYQRAYAARLKALSRGET